VNDSQSFLLEHFDTIQDSPFQIYRSALPLSPSTSWLHKCYSAELSQEVKAVKGPLAGWRACSRTVVLDGVPQALACWKDTIAVGLQSGDITIINAITGSQAAVLSGHTDWVQSLAFSLDGISLVSGSQDTSLKLWDVQTGGVVKTFSGHTSCVLSISSSSDGTLVASGSCDGTVRLWNIQKGECCCVIKHQEIVDCVVFSPTDPQHLISVSDDALPSSGILVDARLGQYIKALILHSPQMAPTLFCVVEMLPQFRTLILGQLWQNA
jgi:WD40 repeat protein